MNISEESAATGATGIPELPKVDKKVLFKPLILIPNLDSEYKIMDCGLQITLDSYLKKVGIWIPETVRFLFFVS